MPQAGRQRAVCLLPRTPPIASTPAPHPRWVEQWNSWVQPQSDASVSGLRKSQGFCTKISQQVRRGRPWHASREGYQHGGRGGHAMPAGRRGSPAGECSLLTAVVHSCGMRLPQAVCRSATAPLCRAASGSRPTRAPSRTSTSVSRCAACWLQLCGACWARLQHPCPLHAHAACCSTRLCACSAKSTCVRHHSPPPVTR